MTFGLTMAAMLAAAGTALPEAGIPAGRPIVALNNDCNHLQCSFPPDEIGRECIRTYFNDLHKGGLTHLILNPNSHNCEYPTKVWETTWRQDPRCRKEKLPFPENNSRIFAEKGIDWVGELVALSREHGVSPWLSMRMNDLHGIGGGHAYATSDFWWKHPEYRRKPGKLKGWSEDNELALDFTHKAVRDRALALVREMLENWDVDGFECDWTRFPHHVPDEAERSRTGCAPLTAVMREVRKIADEIGRRRGKRILVSVRVASDPEYAYGLGSDVATWAREGLVDWVSPCNFWNTTDFTLPFAAWRELLCKANPRVRLVGGLDFAGVNRDSWGPQGLTEAEFAGYLERMYAAGVRDLETFNLFQYWNRLYRDARQQFVQVEGMRDGAAWLRGRDRAYPVTWRDMVPAGSSSG